ncbi:hypothetical protein DesLBE_4147 [Desulfitobacterium sp. LBE]|nr:hypothetical protein DesLBE_4147 [Desulfitobacterium sp. LBE]
MKVLTITLHNSLNCGSSLQAYALQQFIRSLGYDTQIIEYNPKYVANEGHIVRNFLKRIFMGRQYKSKRRSFQMFKERYLVCTDRWYSSLSELETDCPQADVYITGSDQIWNTGYPCGRDPAFYLSFVRNKPKIAYAASLGERHEKNENMELKGWYKNKLNVFSYISVRERASKIFLTDAGLQNIDFVCDPVLLVERQDWLKFCTSNPYGDYIVVYLVEKSKLLNQYVMYLKRLYGCKVILIGSFLNKCHNDIQIYNDAPIDFVNLIYHAKFIITSSFHATVFSHIFSKEFAVIMPKSNAERIEDFLSLTNMKDRIVQSDTDFSIATRRPDYTKAHQLLDKLILHSKDMIKSELAKHCRGKE